MTSEPRHDRALTIHRETSGRAWRLSARQWVPLSPAVVFPFFQDPYNLERITPPFLHFHVQRASTPAIEAGTRIWYRLSLHGVPMWWRTRIEGWAPPLAFEDVQERGPYKLWHHRHEFEERDGGTLMRDVVRYELWMGSLVPGLVERWVAHDVRTIFEYRQQAIAALFDRATRGSDHSVRSASTGSMLAARLAGK